MVLFPSRRNRRSRRPAEAHERRTNEARHGRGFRDASHRSPLDPGQQQPSNCSSWRSETPGDRSSTSVEVDVPPWIRTVGILGNAGVFQGDRTRFVFEPESATIIPDETREGGMAPTEVHSTNVGVESFVFTY
jgi:hypothetical protein